MKIGLPDSGVSNGAEHTKIGINDLSLEDPKRWLVEGWQDFKRAPLIGLAHGLCVSAFGLVLLLIGYDKFWLLAGAFTGFLAVAPVVAVGLYAVSRALEKNEPVSFWLVLQTWLSWRGKVHHDWRLVRFSLLLYLSGTGWVLTSAAFITLFSPVHIENPLDFLTHIVLATDNHLFEIWWILGVALAAPVFASTVVTIPLLLDRQIGVYEAVLVSWKVVLQNPLPMAAWALLIMASVMFGVVLLVGSIIVVPILGHASWHVYRDAVNSDQLPHRAQN